MSTTPKRPQLSVEELLQLKWLLGGLLTLIGISTVFYMDVEAWTLMGLTTLATLATMVRPTLPARVPSLVHTLAFPAIVLFFVVDLWLMTEVLPAMVRLDILLLLYRNISYRQRRDDLQIIVLGLFLVVVAGVLTVSLTFAAQILVYAAGALALLLVVTLSDAVLGAAQRAPVPFGETPQWARHMNVRQLPGRLREVLDWR
ncbi:MAG: transglutaminaseTgpA domain-containing protein, partial [Opitutaceae bacterium]